MMTNLLEYFEDMTEYVVVSKARYDELLKAELLLEIVKQYQKDNGFLSNSILKAFKLEEDEAEATDAPF